MTRGLKLAAAVMALAMASTVGANANALTYFTTIYNTDWTTAGIALRGTAGVGTLNVSGVSGPVSQSYLFWHGPTNTTDPTDNAHVMVNGNAVTGTNIGFSQDNFWGYANSQAYRADTTSIINGNGAYDLSNFTTANSNINGAGTTVFFNDGNSANNRDVVLFDGNDSNFASAYDAAGWDINLNGINYQGGQAFLTMIVSDGQNFGPNDDGTIMINGVALVSGGIFQGSSPGVGVSNGSLWDTETFDITSFLTLGNNNLHITLDAGFSDALSAVVAAIDLPAGAAPPPPNTGVPEPLSLSLFGMGLAGLASLRRRRNASKV